MSWVSLYLSNNLFVLNVNYIDETSLPVILTLYWGFLDLVSEEVPLRLGDAHDIIGGSWLLNGGVIGVGRGHGFSIHIHSGAELLLVKVSE